jgi:tetratricopeptide (TPR) repeat protein
MDGSGEHLGMRAEVPGGRGVQIGDGNRQVNYYIQEYIDQRGPVSAGAAGPVVAGEVPQPPEAFQPRAGLAEELRAAGSGVAVVRAVTGMRGVGKTQVAAAYARWCIDAGWRLVAWVNSADTAGVLGGLAVVAARLGIAEADAPLEVTATAVRNRLEADGDRCLVIFDNVTDPRGLRPFLPAAGQAQVVITTTSQAPELGRVVPVGLFTEDEAVTFLVRRTGREDVAGARALAEELGLLPLALAQAGAVIAAQHIPYREYLERVRSVPVREYLTPSQHEQYPDGVAEAVLLSLEAVTGADQAGLCREVLDVVAVLSGAGVPRELLYAAGEAGLFSPPDGRGAAAGARSVDEALGLLAGGSLLAFSGDDSVVSAHRLVMRVVRECRAREGTLGGLGTTVCNLLDEIGQSIGEPWRNRAAVREVIRQITALHEHLAQHADGDESELAIALLALRGRALRWMLDLGDDIAQAVEFGTPLAADYERMLGADHPATLTSRSNLAAACCNAGLIARAVSMYKRTLADRERVLGGDHPDTLTSRGNLAYAYDRAGRLAEAIPLYERTLADRERVLGGDHPDTLTSRNNLATAYVNVGQLAGAIPMYEQAVAGYKRLLGEDHPETLTSRGNVAAAYIKAGRLAEAIPMYEQILADCERVLGAHHPDTLVCRGNLAYAYDRAGRLAEAIPMYEQTLTDRERVLGANHPETLNSRNNLAVAYMKAGRSAEAIPICKQALADCTRVLGANHPDTNTVRRNLIAAKSQSRPGGGKHDCKKRADSGDSTV